MHKCPTTRTYLLHIIALPSFRASSSFALVLSGNSQRGGNLWVATCSNTTDARGPSRLLFTGVNKAGRACVVDSGRFSLLFADVLQLSREEYYLNWSAEVESWVSP